MIILGWVVLILASLKALVNLLNARLPVYDTMVIVMTLATLGFIAN
jgi:hypothetical protein